MNLKIVLSFYMLRYCMFLSFTLFLKQTTGMLVFILFYWLLCKLLTNIVIVVNAFLLLLNVHKHCNCLKKLSVILKLIVLFAIGFFCVILKMELRTCVDGGASFFLILIWFTAAIKTRLLCSSCKLCACIYKSPKVTKKTKLNLFPFMFFSIIWNNLPRLKQFCILL